MAKISNILPASRIKAPSGGDNRRAIWIDTVLRGHVEKAEGGYFWVEGAGPVHRRRDDAVDQLVVHLLDTGAITLDGFLSRSSDDRVVTEETKDEVGKRDYGLCQYCLMEGRKNSGMEYDHFIPFALGGTSDPSNVQLACYACNRKKWHAHPSVVFGSGWQEWAPGKPRPKV